MTPNHRAEEEQFTQSLRVDALHCAVDSFGEAGAPSTEAVLDRTRLFFGWILQGDQTAKIEPLRVV